MSFVLNDANIQQMSFLDSYNALTDREKKFLEKSWAKYFAEHIFPKIDEKPYAVLYSGKDSRPNTPVNIQTGALIIKEFTGLSDEDMLAALMFDIRFQYALHTTSFLEQPMSDRTLGRFRERCSAYEKETGTDLLHDTIVSLSREMTEMMELDLSLKRMDSLMVASNIKRMGRLELLYTCVANLVKEAAARKEELPEGLRHYAQTDDRNRVIYHNRSEETSEKIAAILKDAAILQNPADPDATYREKVGKQNRGYAANVAEAAGDNGSIVTDYQYEKNTYSDSQFMKDYLEKEGAHQEQATVVADGAYSGKANEELAAEKNVQLVTTNLTGRGAEDIAADFGFNEEGTKVEKCAGGFGPKSCSYNPQTGQCTASFHRSQCEQCPHKSQCRPKIFKRTCRKTISANTKRRAEQQRYRGTEEFKKLSSFRNGVETIPSMLRRKYHVDHMPVRGLIRSRLFFGCKIGALNFGKFCKYMQGCKSYAPNTAMA